MALRSDQLVSRAEVRGSVLGWKQECRCPGFRARWYRLGAGRDL